ncbi:unnamed protein product [Caenorhabditis angaria]|uniref:Uncharacterized protein n=1 Tax=Caenorhabditis angaria TaxID=860376 RepID=A0A9P1IXA3_9PELO|nr:unnamed protein product [Caenorhabditis angaria]
MLLSEEEVPKLLKRKHVISGYRPLNQSTWFYLKSAFTSHNEVFNVWTHFLPGIIFLFTYLIPELRSDHPRVPVIILAVGIVHLLVASGTAHLMHSRSQLSHVFWFLIDFSGIALFGITIGLQRYSCSDDLGLFMSVAYVPLLLIVVLIGQYFSTCYLFCFPTSLQTSNGTSNGLLLPTCMLALYSITLSIFV